jgi:hypothetical protein
MVAGIMPKIPIKANLSSLALIFLNRKYAIIRLTNRKITNGRKTDSCHEAPVNHMSSSNEFI